MDKEFILRYLRKEHLKGNQELYGIAEVKGLEFAKELLRDFASMRFLYIPTLERNIELMREVIADNMHKYSIRELARKTGLSRRKVREIIRDIESERRYL